MVDTITAASSLQSNATTSRSTLTDDFDTFLTLLTAQLENQDPLQPVDSTEFTNQLVQFSGVEQQIQTNEALASLINVTTASTAAGLSGYLGQEVQISTDKADYSGSSLDWSFEIPADAESASLSIFDANGSVVYVETLDAGQSGRQNFQWDGRNTSGDEVANGTYTVSVTAETADGETQSITPNLTTLVNGVDLSSGSTALETPAGLFDFAQVIALRQS